MLDFKQHNEDVRAIMGAFKRGEAPRMPARIRTPTRFFVFSREINREGYTFKDYYHDADVMWQLQLRGRQWSALNFIGDQIMGPPEKEWQGVVVDFHGALEESYLGNEVFYTEDNVIDSHPRLQQEKELLHSMRLPDPFGSGLMSRAREFFEYFEEKRKREDFDGLPVGRTTIQLGTDGPLTLATKIRGTAEVCLDMVTDPDYYHKLMEYIVEATIRRIRAWAQVVGVELPRQQWGFADDAICLVSKEHYREFVLPYHRRLLDAFSLGGPNSLHSCGAAHHLHAIIVQELNVKTFDCGFVTDVARARREVGPNVTYQWRLHPDYLCKASPRAIEEAVAAMFHSGAAEGRRLLVQEVAYAGLKLDNWNTMYQCIKERCVY